MNNRNFKSYRNNWSTQQGPSSSAKQKHIGAAISTSLLVNKAEPTEQSEYISERRIDSLPIHSKLRQRLLNKGYLTPTEIQDKTLEPLLKGQDLLGIAQTGTGKTAAYLVPVIDQLLRHTQTSFALVVVPTRELANQVEEEFRSMTSGLGLYSSCFIGGTSINRDLHNLRRSSHVVIGTPGRLIDLANRRALDFGRFKTLVLDEFDRMLDMGFIHDVKRIVQGMHQRNHTMMFSATLNKSQQALIDEFLTDPVLVKVSSGDRPGDLIDQEIIRLNEGEEKFKVLKEMLLRDEFQKVLLFEETKHRVNRLCNKLQKEGIPVDQIHGDKSQNARQNALNAFKQGRIRVLVATDVASRGLDISDVSHVINYQVPKSHESYIHRVGRTGRAGKIGKALTFVN
jgi:ATP-dependent RNA helicase RhlE